MLHTSVGAVMCDCTRRCNLKAMCVRLSTDVQIGVVATVVLVERNSCSTCSVKQSEFADQV